MSLESNLEKLPEICYTVSDYSNELIILKRGEAGYYPSPLSSPNAEANRVMVDRLNAELGVTKAQEQAMAIGSLFGFHVPGADPALWETTEAFRQTSDMHQQEAMAYSLNDGDYYFYIQTCEDGYDYTIYRSDFSALDGGQVNASDMTMSAATQAILGSHDLVILDCTEYNLEALLTAVASFEQRRLKEVLAAQENSSLDGKIAAAQQRCPLQKATGKNSEKEKEHL